MIDTRGIDRTAARADLERRLDEPHTLALLCSDFNGAPAAATHMLLERAKRAGVWRLERNAALLVLPRANEALAVKDENGVRAQTTDEGYLLKAESVALVLEPLGLVVYDPASEPLTIVAVLHAARDVDRLLKDTEL